MTAHVTTIDPSIGRPGLQAAAEKRTRYVYVINGDDGQPCYIGVGQRYRMHHHIRDARHQFLTKSNPAKTQYFIDCLARGFEPVPYKVAEDLTADEAYAYEKFLIGIYGRRDLGTGPLLNICAGGFGPRDPSPSLRLKRSIAARAMNTPEFRKKKSERQLGKVRSPEFRAKIKAYAGNRSIEHRKKISAANSRRICSVETLQKMAAAKLGKKSSFETRSLISQKLRGELHPNAKLTIEIVEEIRKAYVPGKGAQKALAKKYAISKFHVYKIVHRKIWCDKPLDCTS